MSYEVEFLSELFTMEGKGGWTFAPVPEDCAPSRTEAWGRASVVATVDGHSWKTSVWRERTGRTLLPVPKAVRRGKGHGDTVRVRLVYSALKPARAAPPGRPTMPVDVVSEIVIRRPREVVAAYAADPDNAPAWYVNIEAVEWRSPRPLGIGSRLAFIARFLGRRLAYTYDVRDFVPGERLVMHTAEGPFPMETTYEWRSTPEGGTHMTLRNRGQPAGFSKLAAPFLASAMRRANRKDLSRLKRILESPARPTPGR